MPTKLGRELVKGRLEFDSVVHQRQKMWLVSRLGVGLVDRRCCWCPRAYLTMRVIIPRQRTQNCALYWSEKVHLNQTGRSLLFHCPELSYKSWRLVRHPQEIRACFQSRMRAPSGGRCSTNGCVPRSGHFTRLVRPSAVSYIGASGGCPG